MYRLKVTSTENNSSGNGLTCNHHNCPFFFWGQISESHDAQATGVQMYPDIPLLIVFGSQQWPVGNV